MFLAKLIDTFCRQAYRDAGFEASEEWCGTIARCFHRDEQSRDTLKDSLPRTAFW